MMGKSAIAGWIGALSKGDADLAETFLSSSFRVHDGMMRDVYLRHELSEFRQRRDGFDVPDAPKVVELDNRDGLRHIVVLSSTGNLAYEDWLKLDADGLIVGNDRCLEVVSKISFSDAAERPRRAMAIRSHGAELRQVVPLFPVSFSEFTRCDTYENDRFDILTFDDDQPFVSVERQFRAITTQQRMTFSALMRGTDHPYFIPDRLPRIDGKVVWTDVHRGPIWSVTARMEDGSVLTVDCPKENRIEFSSIVLSVTMTDAVDNDWTSHAGRSKWS
jgi:hypothetical protein